MSEELSRKIAEKLGWTVYSNGYAASICQESIHDSLKPLPDFLSPAVFWPEFEKWFPTQINHRQWRCGYGIGSSPHHFELLGTRNFTEYGKTLTEAGCRCWLAAMEAGGKK